jgi:hypothetical protein
MSDFWKAFFVFLVRISHFINKSKERRKGLPISLKRAGSKRRQIWATLQEELF